jgi:Fe-S-cluster containining protein
MPIHYECVRCTECCRWPGQVELSEAEIARMAAFLGVSELEFIEIYTDLRPDRRGLALRDKPGGECVLLEGRDCLVQPVKPRQCREFPNGWSFPGFETLCRAVAKAAR